jgi:hypothetical protein
MNNKFSLFSPNEKGLEIPLKKTPETISIVGKATEAEFQRLLRTLEFDFPEIHIIYKRISPGKLWISSTDPAEK